MRTSNIAIFVIFLVLIGLLSYQIFFRDDFDLPKGDSAESIEITIDETTGEVLMPDERDKSALTQGGAATSDKKSTNDQQVKKIMITDGVKHSVPLKEILGGGPPKDGIPPIDSPKFISTTKARENLNDSEPGLALSINGVDRFYPFQILVWHEIVNDRFPDGNGGSQRALVTYCPLCLSGIVFDPQVKGERVEFGTSGKLWNSNLVMYDRKTDSLWSQILGEAIVGEMTGTRLKLLPSDQIRFGEWRKLHPNGEVLSRDTGAVRFYGQDPYGDYYTTPGTYFPVNAKDNRLADKDFVLGIVVNGQAKAYLPAAIKRDNGYVEDEFAGQTFVLRYESGIDAVRIFSVEGGLAPDGERVLKRVDPFPNFWFSWVAAHPDTELYK